MTTINSKRETHHNPRSSARTWQAVFPLDFQTLPWICTTGLMCVSLCPQNKSAVLDTQSDTPAHLLYLLSFLSYVCLGERGIKCCFLQALPSPSTNGLSSQSSTNYLQGSKPLSYFAWFFCWHFYLRATSIWRWNSHRIYHLTPLSYWCALQMRPWLDQIQQQ